MTLQQAAHAQLRDELGVIAFGLAALLGTDILPALEQRIAQRAATLVAELDAGEHPEAVAVDILNTLYPHGGPELAWWRTPLGLALAPVIATQLTDEDGWSHEHAATALGVSRGTVSQLVSRGSIERTPQGACSQRSVLTRLVRLAAQRSGAAR